MLLATAFSTNLANYSEAIQKALEGLNQKSPHAKVKFIVQSQSGPDLNQTMVSVSIFYET